MIDIYMSVLLHLLSILLCDHLHLLIIWPCSGELWMQKLKSRLLRTQSLKVLPLKPGVGQYIAIHVTLTTRNFFLISTLQVHSPAFFPKPLLSFSCVSCG